MVRCDVAEIAACKKSELRTIQFKLQKSGRFGGEGREEQLNNASSDGMYGQLWNLALEGLLVRGIVKHTIMIKIVRETIN